MTAGLIAAVSENGVIGLHGKVPWKRPGDMRRFKRVTMGSVVIMGRLTWESMGAKPLPWRRNIVITSDASVPTSTVERYPSIQMALDAAPPLFLASDVWLIGGARIYREAMRSPWCEVIDITYVPEKVVHPEVVRFPFEALDESTWEAGELLVHEDDPELRRRIYTRRVVE